MLTTNVRNPFLHIAIVRAHESFCSTNKFTDEMAPWWAPRHKMTGAYIAEYIKHYPVSEPAEDFKDRGALYGL